MDLWVCLVLRRTAPTQNPKGSQKRELSSNIERIKLMFQTDYTKIVFYFIFLLSFFFLKVQI